jgi:hypothetical protein
VQLKAHREVIRGLRGRIDTLVKIKIFVNRNETEETARLDQLMGRIVEPEEQNVHLRAREAMWAGQPMNEKMSVRRMEGEAEKGLQKLQDEKGVMA